MPAFTLLISSIFFMSIAAIPYYAELLILKNFSSRLLKTKLFHWFKVAILFSFISFYALYMLNFKFIKSTHLNMNCWNKTALRAKEVFTELDKSLPEKTIIFNAASTQTDWNVFSVAYEGMFYGNRICYSDNQLNEEIIEELKSQGYTLAIFTHIDNIPQYIYQDSCIIKIDKVL
jgi:hypothetical protein